MTRTERLHALGRSVTRLESMQRRLGAMDTDAIILKEVCKELEALAHSIQKDSPVRNQKG